MVIVVDRRREKRFTLDRKITSLAVLSTASKLYSGEVLQFIDYSRSGFSFFSKCSFLVGTTLSLQLSQESCTPIVFDVVICNRKKFGRKFRYGVFSEGEQCSIVSTL
ncbi:MAG: PilZ domain-containing protein [Agarilytica sp.]